MSQQAENITFPIGRLVAGSLYTPRTLDADGNPLVFKNGDKKGQPRKDYSFGVAFAKVPGQHWASTEWGAKLWNMGHKVLPNAGERPDFSWKVEDGDSTAVNKKNRRNCDREGYPGHWVVFFTSIDQPAQIWNADASVEIKESGRVKLGYYIQVAGDIKPNGSQSNPGLYVTPRHVAWAGEGDEIFTGSDPSSAGFGQSAAPVGMRPISATPAQTAGIGAPPPAPVAAPAPVAPPVAASAPAPVAAPVAYAPPPAPVAVAPNPAMTQVAAPLAPAGAAVSPPTPSAPVPAPAVPSAPPAPTSPSSGPQMTAAAITAGYTYEALRAAQWSDEQMRAQGYLV